MGEVLPLEGFGEWSSLAGAGQPSPGNPILKDILPLLPGPIGSLIQGLGNSLLNQLEEIRIREGKPLMVGWGDQSFFVHREGGLTETWAKSYMVNKEDTSKTLNMISCSSFYALEEELKKGFLTIKGGHRVGLTGRVILDKGYVKTMKDISGYNFRIAREIRGAANRVLPYLINTQTREFYHTLLISPPRCGKTTLIRDIVRQVSNGIPELNLPGITVGLVDERSEIAGCYEGVPQLDVGVRTDVLDACPKAEGMMMLIRAMAPGMIAADEIGRQEDAVAVLEGLNAGIKVLTTAHGKDLADLTRRPNLKQLLAEKVFERFIILGRSKGVGTVEMALDREGQRLC